MRAHAFPLQMILYNCIAAQLCVGGPTAANLRKVKDVLVPLLRQQLVYEVKFPRAEVLVLLGLKYLGFLLPKLRDLPQSRFKGDATIAELASYSDDDFFRFVGDFSEFKVQCCHS